MGLFSKKYTYHAVTTTPLFGKGKAPLNKSKVGKKTNLRMTSIQKSFLEDTIVNYYKKENKLTTLYKQTINANSLHEPVWSKFKLNSHKQTFYNPILRPEKITETQDIIGNILTYQLGKYNDLSYEYNISKQVDEYDFQTKTFKLNQHKYEYVSRDIFKLLEKPDESELEIGKTYFDKDLNIYSLFDDYLDNVAKVAILNKLKELFGIDASIEANKVQLKEIQTIHSEDITTDSTEFPIKVFVYVTWANHGINRRDYDYAKGEWVYTYHATWERIEVDYTLDKNLFNIYRISKFPKIIFVEYVNTSNKRNIFFGRNPEKYIDKTNKKNLYFSMIYPLKPYRKSKYMDMATEQCGYKNKLTNRTPKRGKNKNKPTDLLTQINRAEGVERGCISQCIDLQWFFLKSVRENKNWRGYLRAIFKFLEKYFTYGTYGKDAPYHKYTINHWKYGDRDDRTSSTAGFKIKYIKREITNTKCSKLCFLSSEPRTFDLYLYLNIPDYSQSTEEEAQQGIFYKFTQYGLSLSHWFGGVHRSVSWTGSKGRSKTSSRRISYVNFYEPSTYHKSKYNTPEEWELRNKDWIGEIKTIGRGFYLDVDTAAYEEQYNRVWGNNGEIIDDGYSEPREEIRAFLYTDDNGNSYTKLVGYTRPHSATGILYDDRLNNIPGILSNDTPYGATCPLMPREVWLRTPFRSKKEVYTTTLFVTTHVSWQEKEGTFFGGIVGIALTFVGVITSWTGVGAKLTFVGIGLIGAGLTVIGHNLQNSSLMMAGSILSVIGGLGSGIAGGFAWSLQGLTNAVQVLAAVTQAAVVLQSFKNNEYLKDLANEAMNEIKASEKEKQEIQQELDSILNLNLYDINTDTGKSIDEMYSISYAEQVYEACNNGTYYNMLKLAESEQYDRLK